MKQIFLYVVLLASLQLVTSTVVIAKTYYGEIQKVAFDGLEEMPNGDKLRRQFLDVKLDNGLTIEAVNDIPLNLSYKIILKDKDQVVLHDEDGEYFIDGYRIDYVSWFLLATFIGLLLLVGGWKGLTTIISLIFKGALLLFFLIPTIKVGFSPILMSSIFCVAASILTITWVGGLNRKTLAACTGAVGGVLVAGLLGSWAVRQSHLTGMLDADLQSLVYQFPAISIPELIAAGVLIGALGATMDVAISVASAMNEIHDVAPDKNFLKLYRAGMNVGRDVMGTMVNTLILAYIGSSLGVAILISQLDPIVVFNSELMMREIILAIVGSIGLILTIPITAALCSYLLVSRH